MKAYAYTDIAQSKKLAEILPLESADMHFERVYFEGHPPAWFIKLSEPIKSNDIIPCWSLAALLDVLPDNIKIDGHRWGLSIRKNSISYLGSMTWDGQLNISVQSDNLIDACYEMILKLHEQNIL